MLILGALTQKYMPNIQPETVIGITFKIYGVYENGKVKAIPEVIENNSPLTIRPTDPITELEGGLRIDGLPKDLANASDFFRVEEHPVDGNSVFTIAMYAPKEGYAHYIPFTAKSVNGLKEGSLASGTLINTVKLTYSQ